jgi:hypothetical protein
MRWNKTAKQIQLSSVVVLLLLTQKEKIEQSSWRNSAASLYFIYPQYALTLTRFP